MAPCSIPASGFLTQLGQQMIGEIRVALEVEIQRTFWELSIVWVYAQKFPVPVACFADFAGSFRIRLVVCMALGSGMGSERTSSPQEPCSRFSMLFLFPVRMVL